MKLLPVTLVLLLAACAGAPVLQRPTPLGVAPAWHVPEGFKLAQPGTARLPPDWWRAYGDALLDELEQAVAPANQTLAQADAQYRQALAAVGTARASLYPGATLNAGAARSQQPILTNGGGLAASQPASNLYTLTGQVSWEPDLWGAIHANVSSAEASAEASLDARDAMLLSLQAQLAVDYFQLRTSDASIQLLDATAASYRRSLDITRVRQQGGVATRADVTQADTQLQGVLAQLADARITRATLEHAIAILLGRSPSEFSIAALAWQAPAWPALPIALPSTLLERRPDIANAERQVDAAAAKLVTTRAAFFPVLNLNASTGFESRSLANWLSLPKSFWSIGPQLTQYLFDAGAHVDAENQAVAVVDQATANYREVVLESFQAVEDNLATLQWLDEEQQRQQAAAASAGITLDIVTRQYQAGTVDYLNVITAEAALLSSQSAVIALEGRRAAAHVQLIKALGGGWQLAEKP
ncbi:MAG: efflux transporter outer membrane subunit [Pseudomonadota bacterium]|nr:efflux transporter outer membrane subunit [Pseudomonadota bacterium]